MNKGLETAEIHELRLCCMEEGYKAVECSGSSASNIDGSLEKHNKMLHGSNQEDDLEQNPLR